MSTPNKSDRARGARIRAARNARGLSVKQLAKLIDVHWKHMYALEQGKHRPGLETLRKLADNLRVSMDHLDLGTKS